MSGYLERMFFKGDVLFKEGEYGNSAYLLTEGKVEISQNVEGKSVVLAVLKPVTILGEMAIFLKDQKRTATAKALEDSKVAEFTRKDLEKFLKKCPQVISSLMNILAYRLEQTTRKATHVPNIFMGVCRVLGLCTMHGAKSLKYEPVVAELSNSFIVDPGKITRVMETLEALQVVSFVEDDQGTRWINFLITDDFAKNAVAALKES